MTRLLLLPLAFSVALMGCVSPASIGLPYMREIDVAAWGTQKLKFEHVEGVKLVKGDNPYDCGPETLAAVLNYFRSDSTSVQKVAKDLGATPTSGTASPQIPIYLRARGLPANMQAGNVTLLRQNCLIGNPSIIMVDAAAVPDSPIPLAERESVFHYFVVIGYSAESREIACASYDGGCVLIAEEYLQKAWSKAGNYVVVIGNLAPEIVPSTAGGSPGTGDLLRDYTAEEHFDFGAVYEDEGRLDDALAQYNFCLKRDPKFALAHVGLGNIAMRKGDRDEALRGYKRALDIDPDLPIALNNLAWLYVEVKAVLPEAESLARRSVAGYRSRLEILDKEAVVAKSGGKETAALLEKIEYKQKQYVSEMGRAMSTLGHSLFLQDKHQEAIASWQEALSLTFPDDEFRARLHYNIGRAYSKSGNASAAETSLRAAFRLTKKTELLRLIGEELEILRNLRGPGKNATPSDRPS